MWYRAYSANAEAESDLDFAASGSIALLDRTGPTESTAEAGSVVIDCRSGDVVSVDLLERAFEPASRRVVSEDGLLGASPTLLRVKRAVDVLVAATMLVLLSVVLLSVALLVKVTSPGPVLYVSDRVGQNGRIFRFLKFRSMYEGAEGLRVDLAAQNEVSGPVFKMKSDPRVTPVGRWIRRFSLDELPQLVNVLRGDMSLVGPRPPTPGEVVWYSPYQRQRLLVKPGLTCFWQVRGRSDIDFEDWVEMDLDYIEQWSPRLDARLVLETIPAVFSGRGAY